MRLEGVEACARMLSTNPLISHLDMDGMYVCCLLFAFCFLLYCCLFAYSFQRLKLIALFRLSDVTDVAHMTSLLTTVGESTALEHLSISNISKDQEKGTPLSPFSPPFLLLFFLLYFSFVLFSYLI